jgi:hypothetical protein
MEDQPRDIDWGKNWNKFNDVQCNIDLSKRWAKRAMISFWYMSEKGVNQPTELRWCQHQSQRDLCLVAAMIHQSPFRHFGLRGSMSHQCCS